MPFKHDSEKQLWREFSSILMQSENHDTELAEVVKWTNFCVKKNNKSMVMFFYKHYWFIIWRFV